MIEIGTLTRGESPDFRGHSGWKDFEKVVLERLLQDTELKRCDAGRYGVQMAVVGKDNDGRPSYQPIRSLPDIEGVLPGGRQFIFDAKVCSASKFDLSPYRLSDEVRGSKCRQLRHLLRRASLDAIAFFLIHWNSRELKTKSEPAETFAFPVSRRCPFWTSFLRGETKALRRSDCYDLAVRVSWNRRSARERRPRPDVLEAILVMAGKTGTTNDSLLYPGPEWKKRIAPIKPES